MRRRFFNIKEVLNNFINYSSYDNQIVTPYTVDFGAILLKNVMIDGVGTLLFKSNVTKIGSYAFSGCSSLTSITIPNSVTKIGGYAFNGCSSLTSITIPNSVTEIGNQAFLYCGSRISVYITDIAGWCNISFSSSYSQPFGGIGNLYLNNELVNDLIIPDSVTEIRAYVFRGCSSLTSITIPEGVKEIGEEAFWNCSSLTSVYCKSTTPPALGRTSVFDNNGSGRKIYVPYQSLNAYTTATNWSEYANDIIGYDFENDVVVKTINYIRMSYSETGPDEYKVRFEADFKPTSNIGFEIGDMSSTMDTTTTLAFINGLMKVPTLEGLTYSPKEDDYYIYEVIMA